MADIDIYAIIGDPISHSKSPDMHNAGFKELGVDAVYTRLAADSAKQALKTAKLLGINGLNITSPFKEEMFFSVDEIHESAEVGAVNTVIKRNGKWIGYNTDVYGIQKALEANNIDVSGMTACVLGAGGAAKAAVHVLRTKGADVTIVNRTIEKAEKLALEYQCKFCSIDNLQGIIPNCDLILSCINTDMRIIPEDLLKKNMIIFESNYAHKTALLQSAEKLGCKIITGEQWLIFQGIKAFELFTGKSISYKIFKKAINPDKTKKRNIALIGFMGSGKTTIAKEMKKLREMNIFDVDNEIVKETNKTIDEIFKTKGESEFRRLEHKKITQVKDLQHMIIDCGGGIVLDECNIQLLKENCLVFLLIASPETIIERIKDDNSRPLVNCKDKKARIQEILTNRLKLYLRAADVIIDTDERTPEQIAKRIIYENNKTC